MEDREDYNFNKDLINIQIKLVQLKKAQEQLIKKDVVKKLFLEFYFLLFNELRNMLILKCKTLSEKYKINFEEMITEICGAVDELQKNIESHD